MRFIVGTDEMKRIDRNTIEYYGVPSAVLMERAALGVCEQIDKWSDLQNAGRQMSVLVLSGCGNNGGDGIAIARILKLKGYKVTTSLIGDYTKCTDQLIMEMKIAENYGIYADTFSNIRDNKTPSEFDIIVDALFGIGCNRPVAGMYAEAVKYINECKKARGNSLYVISVDMPSGVNSDDGHVFNIAVNADETVTFNFEKIGHIMYPGCEYSGTVTVKDVGITKESFLDKGPRYFAFKSDIKSLLPERRADGNKGSFGKVLVIAGSENVSGACTLCAEAAYRAGAGMVKVFTAETNRTAVQTFLPEALIDTYEDDESVEGLNLLSQKLQNAMDWATEIIIGPGIGTGIKAITMVREVLEKFDRDIIMDADALNIIASDEGIDALVSGYSDDYKKVIMTPHLAEFSRLYGSEVKVCKENILEYPKKLADKYNCVIVCKDARTIVAGSDSDLIYINTSGNSGMATAGSGDVLAGIIGAMNENGLEAFEAACIGVYMHGICGDYASNHKSEYSMIAGDIVRAIPEILK